VQQVVADAALQPTQRCRQVRPDRDHPEVFRSQQFVPDGVVRGDVAEPGLHQGTAGPYLLVERHRVGLDRRVGNQSGLQITPPRTERCDAADETVQRQPVHPLLECDFHG